MSLNHGRSLAVYALLPFSYTPCVVSPPFTPTNPRYHVPPRKISLIAETFAYFRSNFHSSLSSSESTKPVKTSRSCSTKKHEMTSEYCPLPSLLGMSLVADSPALQKTRRINTTSFRLPLSPRPPFSLSLLPGSTESI